jgi:iron complex outermembrane receptor protein
LVSPRITTPGPCSSSRSPRTGTSIASFARDADGSDLRIAHLYDSLTQHQFSQELQALGNGLGDRFNWIVGLYYFEESGDNVNLVEFVPVNLTSGGAFATQSWAAFSQATFDVTERFSVTAGLRYTDEEKDFTPDQYITAVHVPPQILPLPPGHAVASAHQEDDIGE